MSSCDEATAEYVALPHTGEEMQGLVAQITERLNTFLCSVDSNEASPFPVEAAKTQPVVEWQDPADLQELVRALTPQHQGHLDVKEGDEGEEGIRSSGIRTSLSKEGSDKVVADFAFLLDRTVKMGHKKCLNQLFHQADTVAILADYLVATINTSIYTYEMNPVVTMVELEILRKLHLVLGWDPETSCGTLPPGGSYSNLYGILCARTRRFPHVAAEGWKTEDRPVIFVSAAAHYSAKKACALMGMGYNALVAIETDEWHRMKPQALRKAIVEARENKKNPFCVIATVGTTLMGAIDPLTEVASICKEEGSVLKEGSGLWFHVDACLGGGLIHSENLRNRYLQGIELADSVAYNAHKMMGITQQCSVFLTQHRQVQVDTFATKAAYLFNADKQYDADLYDVGDRVFQCARRPDCLKLWIMWRYRGDLGMGAYTDLAFKRHVLFNAVLATRRDFVPVLDLDLQTEAKLPSAVPCTCFWWIPGKYRTGPGRTTNRDIMQSDVSNSALFNAIDAPTSAAKLSLMQRSMRSGKSANASLAERAVSSSTSDCEGSAFILTMSRAKNWPNFWRFVANGAHSWSTIELNALFDDVSDACEKVHSL